MNKNYPSKINLNYLRVFEAVYHHKSTQKAATSLGISQSAVSQTLSKLRDFTGDRLFYSAGGGLQPTHRADMIASDLTEQLRTLDDKLNSAHFIDPKSFSGQLTIAVSSVLLEAIATELTSSIVFEHLPNAKLDIVIWNKDTPQDILEGRVQLGINFYPADTPKYLRCVPLISSEPVILSRNNHPICKRELTVDTFVRYPTGGIVIPGLPDYGLTLSKRYPNVFDFKYRSASMAVLINLVKHSDLLVVTEKLAASAAHSQVQFHQPDWLSDYVPQTKHHAIYYLEKNHNTPFYTYCIKAISEAVPKPA